MSVHDMKAEFEALGLELTYEDSPVERNGRPLPAVWCFHNTQYHYAIIVGDEEDALAGLLQSVRRNAMVNWS